MYPSSNAIETKIKGLLPADETPVLNRVMLVRVRQAFEAAVSQNDYFDAVDALETKRVIGRMRGAGGQIFLLAKAKADTKPLAEKALMVPTLAYLKREFIGLLELPKTSSAVVVDASRMGPVRGTWARPDFVLVTAATYAFMPGRHVDVHSFELKNTAGGSISSVHEALAQTRFTHYGHFIWHLPRGAKKENMMPAVLDQCDKHGIGFVRIYDPSDTAAGWEVLKTARRTDTQVGIVDNFLSERLTSADHAALFGNERGAARGV